MVQNRNFVSPDDAKSIMQMVDGEVPQPLATADEEAAREDAASAHLQHDSAKEEVTTEETYCELPAPKFHQMREYDRIFRLVVFGNGVTAGLAGRRGCARTEVENQKDIAVEFAFFRLFGISVRRQVANQFQMGQHDASTSIRIMMWRLAFAVGVDLAIWIEDGKKYTSTATRIDVEVRFPSDGFDSVYVMNWETAKDGKTGRRSAKKSVRAQFAMIPLPIMEHRMPWGAESQGVTDEQVGETDTDPPPSSFSLLIEGLREMIRLIREPLTPTTRGTQATAPNLQTSGVNAAVRGTEIGQSHLETPSRPENEAPPATTAVDLEAQPMQSDPPKTVPTKKLKGRRKRPKTPQHFVVIGIFSPLTGIPSERLVTVSKPKHLFRDLWWGIMRLRGIEAFVSLKDVKGFAVYQVSPTRPSYGEYRGS